MTKKPIETEVKIKINTHIAKMITSTLHNAALKPKKHHIETNIIFDTKKLSLKKSKQVLRVRYIEPIGGGCSLNPEITFKKKARRKNGISSRVEINIRLCGNNDIAATLELLKGLGFKPTFMYEKIRCSYELNKTLIEIDEIPMLGYFLEIEGKPKHIEASLKWLNLEYVPRCESSYINLLRDCINKKKIKNDVAVVFSKAEKIKARKDALLLV